MARVGCTKDYPCAYATRTCFALSYSSSRRSPDDATGCLDNNGICSNLVAYRLVYFTFTTQCLRKKQFEAKFKIFRVRKFPKVTQLHEISEVRK